MLEKVLVANRGEIAVRIIRALRELGRKSVAVYSEPDVDSPHVQMSDEAYCLGPAPPLSSYLSVPALLSAAAKAGAQGIHPGYGFLAENAGFAAACKEAGITFIGPSSSVIESMGDKLKAREAAIEAQVPVVPGARIDSDDDSSLLESAREVGFPLLLKSVGGGGGKGMRVVTREEDLLGAFQSARSEAEKAFANPEIYLERYLTDVRHVEIQVAGDSHGNAIHFGERECSVQRRHQKVVEETPSPTMTSELRDRMTSASLSLCRRMKYTSLGTVEFLVDGKGDFYFLEMNTRLQVEHPVTELVTGQDLVALQIRLAEGATLFPQEEVQFRGHAIEVRICAEDPYRNFVPSVGTLDSLVFPQGPHVRVDSGVKQGQSVTLFYDPMVAKISVWAQDRPAAIQRMKGALSELQVGGVKTTGPLALEVLEHPRFIAGEWGTAFLEGWLKDRGPGGGSPENQELSAILGAILRHHRERGALSLVQAKPEAGHTNPWVVQARREGTSRRI